jgi:NADPH-dependent glutamate synthase beta subunit-like oxidoreductase
LMIRLGYRLATVVGVGCRIARRRRSIVEDLSTEERPSGSGTAGPGMPPTDTADPAYFHKVVDCQWACPAHTPVPEYIRLIAAGRYADAYMVNWRSNVFPGVLGRTCDRPCEPACRRGRVEPEPVAICRLKRVAADNKGDIRAMLPGRRRSRTANVSRS